MVSRLAGAHVCKYYTAAVGAGCPVSVCTPARGASAAPIVAVLAAGTATSLLLLLYDTDDIIAYHIDQ